MVSACTGGATGTAGGFTGAAREGAGSAPDVASSRPAAIARDGVFDVNTTNEARFQVAIDGVLRGPERTVLRLTVTNLENTAQVGIDRFGDSSSDQSFLGFRLLDPVGAKLQYGLRLGSKDGLGFGSRLHQTTLQPGVRHPAVAYFSPLPANVDTVTVLSPGTTGLTGVLVTDGDFEAQPAATDGATEVKQILENHSPRPPGATVELPPVEPAGDVWSSVADVSAVAKEIAAGGDPRRPISVVGHTDSIGSASANQLLSVRKPGSLAPGDSRRRCPDQRPRRTATRTTTAARRGVRRSMLSDVSELPWADTAAMIHGSVLKVDGHPPALTRARHGA